MAIVEERENMPMQIAIAGLGTVGCALIAALEGTPDHGVASILAASNFAKERSHNAAHGATVPRIKVAGVSARDKNRDRGIDLTNYAWFDDPRLLAVAPEVDVFVELIGGAEGIARESVEAALRHGKHVVTANKALLARHGPALAKLAEDHQVSLKYEAAIAGAIPIVSTILTSLAGVNISALRGILNGTCNYILSQMENAGKDYDSALIQAQALGFAEADPTLDVGGGDSAHKLCILSALCFGVFPTDDEISVTGIDGVCAEDIIFAKANDYVIRLIGESAFTDDQVTFNVAPFLVPCDNKFARIVGADNHIEIRSDLVPSLHLTGPGAGGGPTASAVAGDIFTLLQNQNGHMAGYGFGRPEKQLRIGGCNGAASGEHGYYFRAELLETGDNQTIGGYEAIAKALKAANIPIKVLENTGPEKRLAQGITANISGARVDDLRMVLSANGGGEETGSFVLYRLLES